MLNKLNAVHLIQNSTYVMKMAVQILLKKIAASKFCNSTENTMNNSTLKYVKCQQIAGISWTPKFTLFEVPKLAFYQKHASRLQKLIFSLNSGQPSRKNSSRLEINL